MEQIIKIENLSASVDNKKIINGLTMEVNKGEIHTIMGPNGSGKSTLSNILAGHPKYKLESGTILFEGKDLGKLSPTERAKLGIFLAFQYPVEIQGVSLRHFLYTILKQKNQGLTIPEFKLSLDKYMSLLGIDQKFLERHLNVGFSGGEKKRAEVLQLLMLKPKLAILDETDSGLDVDSLKTVAKAINSLRNKEFSAIIITHYPHILEYLKPDYVHIIGNGKILATDKMELAKEVQRNGYKKWVGTNE